MPPVPSGEARAAAGAVDAAASTAPVADSERATPDLQDAPDLPDAPEVAATAEPVTVEPIRASETHAAAPAEERPNADQTRLEILEALRRGEITTDEALLLLRQMDE